MRGPAHRPANIAFVERSVAPLPASAGAGAGIAGRFAAFVAERHPFALAPAVAAFETVCPGDPGRDAGAIEALRPRHAQALLPGSASPPSGLPEMTPGVSVASRLEQARRELLESCDGFLAREAIAAGLTREERIEILRGMLLTRATDNRLKAFFSQSKERHRGTPFQGKGFRSLDQEAIYAAEIRLRADGK